MTMIRTISILGCGWLGLPLGKHLADLGFIVKGSTTSLQKMPILESAGILPYHIIAGETLKGEIGDFFHTDVLFLNIPPGRKNPDVENTYPNQVKTIVKEGLVNGIPNLIFASSTSVYGKQKGLVDEQTLPLPDTASGMAILIGENWLLTLDNLNTTIVRLAGLIGSGRNPARFLSGKTNLPNGAAPVNLIKLEDVILAITTIIRKESWNTVYNICSDDHPTRESYYTQKAIESQLPAPHFLPDHLEEWKVVSNEKIKNELGISFSPL